MNPSVLRTVVRGQPLQSFTMRLADGRAISIPHPELVAVSNRSIVVINPTDESITFLEPLLVASVETTGSPPDSIDPQANGGPPDGGPLSPTRS